MILFMKVYLYRIHKEIIIQVTYEAARGAVDRLCEGWEAKYNNHKLENLTYKLACEESTKKLQDLAYNIFSKTTNNALGVQLEPIDSIGVYTFIIRICSKSGQCTCEGISRPWLGTTVYNLTKKQFTNTLLQDIKRVLGRALVTDCIDDLTELSEIARGLTLVELAMEQNKFFNTIQSELIQRTEEYKKFNMDHRAYCAWRITLKTAMLEAAEAWSMETSLVPGMKIAVRDMITQHYTTEILEALSGTNSAAILDLMDGSRIPKAGPRYYSVGTWFANNDRYREIATTLDFPEARGMCYD